MEEVEAGGHIVSLSERSKQIRRDTIKLSAANGGYHYGGSFSCVEILIALYDHVLGPDDRFILSKGHACWPWYVLLRERGFDPRLEGHPKRDPHNGVLATTGSLGHGLPTAVGLAQAKKMKGEPGRVFVLMGDGECQTGTTWESMLIARQLFLHNLVAIVDWNGIQGSARCLEVLPLEQERMRAAAEALGWLAAERDGHDVERLVGTLNFEAADVGLPFLLIANTVKGKGVSFMENDPKWHSNWLGGEQLAQALGELA